MRQQCEWRLVGLPSTKDFSGRLVVIRSLKRMHKACHSTPAEVMIVNVPGKNSKEAALTLIIDKLVLSLFSV